MLKRQRDQRDREKEGCRERETERGGQRGETGKSEEEERKRMGREREREVNEWAGKRMDDRGEGERLREREEACGGM